MFQSSDYNQKIFNDELINWKGFRERLNDNERSIFDNLWQSASNDAIFEGMSLKNQPTDAVLLYALIKIMENREIRLE